jgi:H+/Cl- antiporter ClcA
VLFFGYETLGNIFKNEAKDTWLSLLTLTSLKLTLTASSLGSGLIGGIFAPSLFLGATLGAGFEQVCMHGIESCVFSRVCHHA